MNSPAPKGIATLMRGVRVHYDPVREKWFLLAPERAMELDDIGAAILQEVDGVASLDAVVKTLATRYHAPEQTIRHDVENFFTALTERMMMEPIS